MTDYTAYFMRRARIGSFGHGRRTGEVEVEIPADGECLYYRVARGEARRFKAWMASAAGEGRRDGLAPKVKGAWPHYYLEWSAN